MAAEGLIDWKSSITLINQPEPFFSLPLRERGKLLKGRLTSLILSFDRSNEMRKMDLMIIFVPSGKNIRARKKNEYSRFRELKKNQFSVSKRKRKFKTDKITSSLNFLHCPLPRPILTADLFSILSL